MLIWLEDTLRHYDSEFDNQLVKNWIELKIELGSLEFNFNSLGCSKMSYVTIFLTLSDKQRAEEVIKRRCSSQNVNPAVWTQISV